MIAGTVLLGLKTVTTSAQAIMKIGCALAPKPQPIASDRPLNVLFLANYPLESTGTKYRLTKWGQCLEKNGHSWAVSPPLHDSSFKRLAGDWSPLGRAEFHLRMLANRSSAVLRASKFDVAVIHMTDLPYWEYGQPFVAQALKKRVGRILLDLDDLPVIGGEEKLRSRVIQLARVVDGLILGNRELAAHLPPRPTWFIPTCVEPSEWPRLDRGTRNGPAVLGWVGTASNLQHLESIAPALAGICRRFSVRIRVVCNVPPRLDGVPFEFVPWSMQGEVEDLLPIDIGLAPLADSPVSRCKCGLKALQYMAAGVPVIASPVGALRTIVQPGVTGFHASRPTEWVAGLETLLQDKDVRLRMGAAARASVDNHWCFDVHRETFVRALYGIPEKPSTGPMAQGQTAATC